MKFRSNGDVVSIFKKTGLALAIATALPLSAVAQEKGENFDTFFSGAYSNSRYDGLGSRQGGGEFRLSSAYTHSSGFGAQIDTVYSRLRLGSSDSVSLSGATTDFAGHVYFRNQTGLIGLIAQHRTFDLGVSNADVSADASADISMDLIIKDRTFFGLEGQAYFGDLTIAAQGGKQYLNSPAARLDGAGRIAGNFASLEARYFLEDNWKLSSRYSYGKLASGLADFGIKSQSFGIGTEYRFSDSPVSVFLNLDTMRSSFGSDAFDSNRVMVGAKLNFGQTSLKSRDRNGASLNPVGLDNLLINALSGV